MINFYVKQKFGRILILVLFLFHVAFSENPRLTPNQYNALYDFYNSTNGQYWIWPGASNTSRPWDFNIPGANPCYDYWQGIACICDTAVNLCDLLELYVNKHNLSGTLPDTMNAWFQLTYFDVSTNNITGTVPESISGWTKMNAIFLYVNHFTGPLPKAIGSLTELNRLDISTNRFDSIPEEFYNATKLEFMEFEYNRFRGTISKNIGNLNKLKTINLIANELTGSIPEEIGNLIHLYSLELSYNHFNSSLPDSLGYLNLSILSINENEFTGTLPSSLGNLVQMEILLMYDNKFFGPLPSSLGNLNRAQVMDFWGNLFTGTIPTTFQNLTAMKQFYAEHTSLHGYIDPILIGMKKLQILELTGNFFSGSVPDNHVQATNDLGYLAFSQNRFTGQIPINSEWTQIYDYEMADNFFTGPLLSEFSFLPNLYFFWVGENYLTGSIPYAFFNAEQLTNLNLTANLLSKQLPNNITNVPKKLAQVLVSYNFLTGPLPENIGYITSLIVLSLHHNHFTSTVPHSYRKLIYLEQFFIQNNQFKGSVTTLLNNTLVHTINNIDLSNNQFTGTLPNSYFRASELKTFSAVSNCLSGSIPQDICDSRSITALSLDGISTASACRVSILPGFTGFTLKHYLQGTIPQCLFNMPNLQSLHLSGNGFTGTIPSNLTMSKTLDDLSLSHNILSGTIPSKIQERKWLNLDLSYNKLTGTLSSDFISIPNNGSLYLEVNRLSGVVPNSLLNTQTINILEGNLFACTDNEDLPEHDPNDKSYSCGSNTVNYILFAWIAMCFMIIIGIFVIYYILHKERQRIRDTILTRLTLTRSTLVHRSKHDENQLENINLQPDEEENPDSTADANSKHNSRALRQEKVSSLNANSLRQLRSSTKQPTPKRNIILVVVDKIINKLRNWIDAIEEFTILQPNSNIHMLTTFLQQIRYAFCFLSLFCLMILLPIYTGLKQDNKSYTNEYAWTISGILFSGQLPAKVLFVFFILLILIVFNLLKNVFNATRRVKYLKPKDFSHPYSSDPDVDVDPSFNGPKFSREITLFSFSSSLFRLSNQLDYQAPDDDNVIKEQMTINKMDAVKVYIVELIIFIINTTLLGIVDFAYVLVAINNNSVVITFAAFLLAIFRLVTNNILLWRAIPITSKWVIYIHHKLFPKQKIPEISLNPSIHTHPNDPHHHHLNNNNNNNNNDDRMSDIRSPSEMLAPSMSISSTSRPVSAKVEEASVINNNNNDNASTVDSQASTIPMSSRDRTTEVEQRQPSYLKFPPVNTNSAANNNNDQNNNSNNNNSNNNNDANNPRPSSTRMTDLTVSSDFPLNQEQGHPALDAQSKQQQPPTAAPVPPPPPPVVEYEKLPDDFWSIPYIFTSHDISFLERLMLFNNLIIPIIAILIILPDCFYNAFFAPATVTSSYQYYNCAEYYDRGIIGYDCTQLTQDTSYTPPFIYSYQCSSKIVINYVPVYIMMFIFVGVIMPIKNIVFKLAYDYYYKKVRDDEKEIQEIIKEKHSTESLQQFKLEQKSKDWQEYSEEERLTILEEREKQEAQILMKQQSHLQWNIYWFHWFEYFLPENLKTLKSNKDSHQPMLFAKLKLTTQLSSYLAIMIAIGGLFPPLTVIGCVTVITITYYEELMIGRLLFESNRLGYLWYVEKLEEDCVGITESLNLSLRSTVLVTCALFAYILFDTWGDEEGWEAALPVTILMAFCPLMVAFLFQCYRNYYKWKKDKNLEKINENFKKRYYSDGEAIPDVSVMIPGGSVRGSSPHNPNDNHNNHGNSMGGPASGGPGSFYGNSEGRERTSSGWSFFQFRNSHAAARPSTSYQGGGGGGGDVEDARSSNVSNKGGGAGRSSLTVNPLYSSSNTAIRRSDLIQDDIRNSLSTSPAYRMSGSIPITSKVRRSTLESEGVIDQSL